MIKHETPETVATARPAATLIITRKRVTVTQVFLAKRHNRAAFMPAFHVFPGGCLEQQDYDLAQTLVENASDEAITQTAHRIAAIRETAEECGFLFARSKQGDVPAQKQATHIFEALQTGRSFIDLLAIHRLKPDLEVLRPVGRWITPENQPLRYDTRFFWTSAPPDQRGSYDDFEVTDSVWMAPADALAACDAGRLTLAPPTLSTLEQLRDASRPAAFADQASGTITPLCPVPVRDAEGHPLLVLPGDPLHPSRSDADAITTPHRTRFRVLNDGRFA